MKGKSDQNGYYNKGTITSNGNATLTLTDANGKDRGDLLVKAIYYQMLKNFFKLMQKYCN
ncbi:Uncharacterised protein [Actinobacillus equuli]|nr:Uncharacterised protein [Actinobacillus equuli]